MQVDLLNTSLQKELMLMLHLLMRIRIYRQVEQVKAMKCNSFLRPSQRAPMQGRSKL